MSYRLSHIGEAVATPVPAEGESAQPSPMIATPAGQAAIVSLQLMGVALIPWLPVAGGVWVGKKYGGSDGAWLGAAAGLTLSVVAMSSLLRKVGS